MHDQHDNSAIRRAAPLAVLLLATVSCLTIAFPAAATAAYAKQTGESCAQCHTSAAGGGPLTPAGAAFKANGDKLPKAAATATPSTQPTAPDAGARTSP
jgi:mono/diheme cytochrome c family protein